MSDIHSDITEIKETLRRQDQTLVGLVKETAVSNHIINEHHKRSMMLEEAIKPIQIHVSFMQKILYFAGAVLLAVVIKWATEFFL